MRKFGGNIQRMKYDLSTFSITLKLILVLLKSCNDVINYSLHYIAGRTYIYSTKMAGRTLHYISLKWQAVQKNYSKTYLASYFQIRFRFPVSFSSMNVKTAFGLFSDNQAMKQM